MTDDIIKDWEKEFDEFFEGTIEIPDATSVVGKKLNIEIVKDFIREQISLARKQGAEEERKRLCKAFMDSDRLDEFVEKLET